MENNLDDILVDSPENNENNKGSESKRKILIGIASGLLISVVILAAYFVLTKEEQPQGLEITHDELERFVNPVEEKESELKEETKDDFDHLIAEIKANQNQNETQNQESQTPQIQPADSVQKLAENKMPDRTQEANQQNPEAPSQTQAKKEQKPQNKPIQSEKKTAVKAKPAQKKEVKSEVKPASKPQNKQTQPANKPSNQTKTAGETFNTLGAKIPQGFYLQVGVFGSKPNADFLNKIAQFPHKVEKLDRGGKVVNRYLIGGFKSRAEAESKINEVTQKISKPIIVEIP